MVQMRKLKLRGSKYKLALLFGSESLETIDFLSCLSLCFLLPRCQCPQTVRHRKLSHTFPFSPNMKSTLATIKPNLYKLEPSNSQTAALGGLLKFKDPCGLGDNSALGGERRGSAV
jgi:hypothetical protein